MIAILAAQILALGPDGQWGEGPGTLNTATLGKAWPSERSQTYKVGQRWERTGEATGHEWKFKDPALLGASDSWSLDSPEVSALSWDSLAPFPQPGSSSDLVHVVDIPMPTHPLMLPIWPGTLGVQAGGSQKGH